MKVILTALSACVMFVSSIQMQASSVSLVCPADVWLNCGAEIWDLSTYGNAYYYKNGYQYSAGSPNVVYNLTTCETGTIYRTWQIEDENWNLIECTQKIYIGGGNFSYYNIQWPEEHLQLYGCNVNTHPDYLPQGYGRPTFDYMTCSMVGTSYKDQVFNFGPDCKKILRTWTVLDWCNYGSGGNNPGIWKFVQTIKISGTNEPTLTCAPEVTVQANECDSAYVSVPLVNIIGQPCYGGYTVTNDSRYALSGGADASGTYPIGKTRVTYLVEYACGEQKYCITDVIVDEKGPVPYCLAKLTVALMGIDTNQDGAVDDGMVEIWAKDLDYASFHPCNNSPLKFSFSSDIDSTSRTFTCGDMGYNDVQLWVTDIYGNQSWCAVTIIVQNNAANIPDCILDYGGMIVNGDVKDYNDEPLEGVFVNLRSKGYQTSSIKIDTILTPIVVDSFYTAGGLLVHMFDYIETYQTTEVNEFVYRGSSINLMTNENGSFGTNEIDRDRQYNLTAFKQGDMSMIDQEDINLLEAYLQGNYEFKNMYTFFAADINEDGEINYEDLTLLNELYEGEEDEWPNERQWVFYDKYEMDSMEGNPLSHGLHQQIILNQDNTLGQRSAFLGILKGDLGNYENAVSKSRNNKIELRNNGDNNQLFSVYPNPFSDSFVVSNDSNEQLTVSIYTIEGKLLYTDISSDANISINESREWNSGSYLYTIISDSETKTGRIIKM